MAQDNNSQTPQATAPTGNVTIDLAVQAINESYTYKVNAAIDEAREDLVADLEVSYLLELENARA
jgi:hypothetical protein